VIEIIDKPDDLKQRRSLIGVGRGLGPPKYF